MRIFAGICALAVIGVCFLAGATMANAESANPVVRTESGKVEGEIVGDVAAFKGIPFAAPPVGDLRWRAPQPVEAWDGVRQVTEYANDCMQLPFPSDAAPLGTEPSEDCLYLNVWRPAEATKRDRLPVLAWIHGGGFVNGGSSPEVYDGSAFAEQGVIFVSFNYRLGRFGFFAHPALTAAAEGPLGNYGYMDQIAALKWVQENIAAFGGDPDKVTIVGESAGGGSVINLMSTPAADGLFERAIVMSGGGRMLMGNTRHISKGRPDNPSAEAIGVNFAKSVGVEGAGPEALAALRALPAEKIVGDLNLTALFGPPSNPPTHAGGPFVDGEIVVGTTEKRVDAGELKASALMIGTTGQDIGFSAAQSKDELFSSFGPYAEAARKAYDPDGSAELRALALAVGADRAMHEPARFIAKEMSAQGVPVYFYRFTYVADSMRSEWPDGAPHATEIPFFFDTIDAKYGDAVTENDAAAAKAANAYFANFAKSGDPNGPGLPHWSAFAADTSNLLDFTLEEGPVEMTDPWKSRLDAVENALGALAGTSPEGAPE